MTHRSFVLRCLPLPLLAAILCMASIAHADPGRRRGPPGGLVAKHAEELGVDAATQARIDEVIRTSGQRDEALREDHREARDRLRETLSASDPDEALVMSQAEAIEATEAEIHKNRLRAILEIRRQLTPEQREILLRLRDVHRQGHPGKGRGRGARPCDSDLRGHCSGSESGKTRLACLSDHWEVLSDRCRDAFERTRGPSDAP